MYCVKENKRSIWSFVAFFIAACLFLNMFYRLESEEERRILKEGLEATVEVLDKERVAGVKGITTYKLKLYVHKELREVSVKKSIYDVVEIGDEVDIVLYEDRLIVLGDEEK